MKFSRIVFVLLLPFFLISCQNGSAEKQNEEPIQNEVPAIEYQKTEKSLPKPIRNKPYEKPLHKEVKKKKLRANDTLKPVVALP